MITKVLAKQQIIKNINGTYQKECLCGSWLEHWMNYSGQPATLCSVKGCCNVDLLGVHVQKAESYFYHWYIVPLCTEHSNSIEPLELKEDTCMVTAHKSLTCG